MIKYLNQKWFMMISPIFLTNDELRFYHNIILLKNVINGL